jgi:hypothetical protein
MLHQLTDYLNDVAEHADDCSSRLHSAAECSCGLADARAEAEDATELVEDFLVAARELTANWEGGDIAGPATELAQLVLRVDKPNHQ